MTERKVIWLIAVLIALAVFFVAQIARAGEIIIQVKVQVPNDGVYILMSDIIINIPHSEKYGSQLPYILPKGTEILVGGDK